MQEIIGASRDGVVPDRSGRALGDFLDEWLEMQKDRLRPSTLYSYQVVVERIKTGLEHAKIQSLTPLQIEQFYASLIAEGGTRGQGLSAKTVRNTHVVLRKALSDAERLEVVVRNAAAAARPPISARPESATRSYEQLREFLDFLKDDRLHTAFVLLATTGMRRGKVLGLRWQDVDFDGRDLAVANSLTTAGPRRDLSDDEVAARRDTWTAPAHKAKSGTLWKYIRLVDDASNGCITDGSDMSGATSG